MTLSDAQIEAAMHRDARRTQLLTDLDAAVKALIRETGRIEVTPAEYRSARKLPRFGGAS